jgi:plastocyanin
MDEIACRSGTKLVRMSGATLAAATLAGAALAVSAQAADLQIEITGSDGKPVAAVVATATPLDPTASAPAHAQGRTTAVMDQISKAFVPQVLAIGAGTWVEFPNSDTVSHQVYSFSPVKRFQLPLYKGQPRAPVQFDKPGLVVLGCNIHDSMVGYIYVADTPYFGKSDAAGSVRLADLPRGRYRIVIWSQSVADDPSSLIREADIDAGADARIEFKLKQRLRSSPEPRPHPDTWDAY